MARASGFKLVMTREQPTVHQQLHDRNRELTAENEKKLKSIISTIEFCGKQNLALRGHRSENWDSEDLPESNPGNFLALLNFRHDAGDQSVAKDFHVVPGSGGRAVTVTYRSPKSKMSCAIQ